MGKVLNYFPGKTSQIEFEDGRRLIISVTWDRIEIREPGFFKNFNRPPLAVIKSNASLETRYHNRLWGTRRGDMALFLLVDKAKGCKLSNSFIKYCKSLNLIKERP